MKTIFVVASSFFFISAFAQKADENIRLAIQESANRFSSWKGTFHKTHWDCKHTFELYKAIISAADGALELTLNGHSESVVRQKFARVESFVVGALPLAQYSSSKTTMSTALGMEKTVYTPVAESTGALPNIEIFFRKINDELYELVIRIIPA